MSHDSSPPVVSVVLPTRNRADSLSMAIRSVLDGTFRELELIVVDDGSIDETAEVLASMDDERLRVRVLETPGGAAAARNVAIGLAEGEFVAFQDSDDVWTQDHLEVLVSALRSAGAETAVAFGVGETDQHERIPPRGPVPSDMRDALAVHNVVCLPASVVRRSALEAIGGFDPVLPRLQDWDLFLALSRQYRSIFVDHIVLRIGTSADRISQNQPAYYLALERILDRHPDLFALAPRSAVAHRMQLVRRHIRVGELRPALRSLAASLRQPSGLLGWFTERVVRGRSPVRRR